MTKKYIPERKKYNDLSSLSKEMEKNKVKHNFDGIEISTKKQVISMYDGELEIREVK
jgi:hypothetical protein